VHLKHVFDVDHLSASQFSAMRQPVLKQQVINTLVFYCVSLLTVSAPHFSVLEIGIVLIEDVFL
jgi:hypothetical protein